jgi:hypothetical protein
MAESGMLSEERGNGFTVFSWAPHHRLPQINIAERIKEDFNLASRSCRNRRGLTSPFVRPSQTASAPHRQEWPARTDGIVGRFQVLIVAQSGYLRWNRAQTERRIEPAEFHCPDGACRAITLNVAGIHQALMLDRMEFCENPAHILGPGFVTLTLY